MSAKFYFLLGINSAGTFVTLIKAYKNDAMVKTQVCKWFFCFKSNETMIDDKPCSRPPTPYKTLKFRKL